MSVRHGFGRTVGCFDGAANASQITQDYGDGVVLKSDPMLMPGENCTKPDGAGVDAECKALAAVLSEVEGHGHDPWDEVGALKHESYAALLYLGPSPKTDQALALAEELGLTIYRSVEEIPKV